MAAKELSIIDHLDRCTVRIETDDLAVGTGFFLAATNSGAQLTDSASFFPLIITNNHVIDTAKVLKMVLTMRDGEGEEVRVGVEENVSRLQRVKHPNGLDLTALNLVEVLRELHGRGLVFAGAWTTMDIIPDRKSLADIGPLSDVVMVGYPSGIWDEVHNKPVFRRGITATHPAIAWNGNPEFLIDTATYGGSSGSPVFAYSTGGYFERGNYMLSGTRLLLIGVTRAVLLHTTEGEIEMIDTPAQQRAVPFLGLPNNLGVCIQAGALQALIQEAVKPRTTYSGWAARWG